MWRRPSPLLWMALRTCIAAAKWSLCAPASSPALLHWAASMLHSHLCCTEQFCGARETATAPVEPAGTSGATSEPAAGKVTYRDIFLRWVWLGCAVNGNRGRAACHTSKTTSCLLGLSDVFFARNRWVAFGGPTAHIALFQKVCLCASSDKGCLQTHKAECCCKGGGGAEAVLRRTMTTVVPVY